MGLFGKIGQSFDSIQGQQQKMQQMQQQQQQQQQSQGGSIFSGGLGGASIAQQVQQSSIQSPTLFTPFGMNPFLSPRADAQQQKDFRRLETYIIKMCIHQCLKKEKNFHADSEICMTKCYDTAFIYTRVGLNELNQFVYENHINS